MKDAIITLQDVSYRYPDGTLALSNCSLSIGRASKTVVLGSNGAGKTTLFLHLNGLLPPSTGKLFFDGKPYQYNRPELRNLRSKVGLVFQNPDNQLFSASIREDVSFGPMNLGLPEIEVRSRVHAALLAVGMLEEADKPVHNLSYGQKKRVCIAGVLAMQPDVLVLDEPMAGLDSVMQKELTALLDTLQLNGMTIVIATHDLDFSYAWADQAIVLQKGSLLALGIPKNILGQIDVQKELGGEPFVAEISRLLTLLGIDLRDKSNPPRSRSELIQAIQNSSIQEQKV